MINFDELFKNHQATRTDCGPLSIITYKKPKSFEHGLRYIFDNELSTLTITGDWLKAIAVNVNNMGSPDRLYDTAYKPHFGVCRYGDYELDFDIGYLNSKIVTKDKSNSYESLDYHEVEQHVKSVLGLDDDLDDRDDEEAHAIHTIIQSILDMIDEGETLCEENFEYCLTDDEQFEIEELLDEYDVSLEQFLNVEPINDALVVAFEGFKRAYEELLEKEN